jgi:DNA-directed RNA polymerase subunit beta
MSKKRPRTLIGTPSEEVLAIPHLIDIQLDSYERFLQKTAIEKGSALKNEGLQAVFDATFPIESPNGDMILQFENYIFDNPKYNEIQVTRCHFRVRCKRPDAYREDHSGQRLMA